MAGTPPPWVDTGGDGTPPPWVDTGDDSGGGRPTEPGGSTSDLTYYEEKFGGGGSESSGAYGGGPPPGIDVSAFLPDYTETDKGGTIHTSVLSYARLLPCSLAAPTFVSETANFSESMYS